MLLQQHPEPRDRRSSKLWFSDKGARKEAPMEVYAVLKSRRRAVKLRTIQALDNLITTRPRHMLNNRPKFLDWRPAEWIQIRARYLSVEFHGR